MILKTVEDSKHNYAVLFYQIKDFVRKPTREHPTKATIVYERA